MTRCRIMLKPLSEKESGYSKTGLIRLTQDPKFSPQLPFSRQDFAMSLPQKQKGMSISGYQPKLQLIIQNGQFNTVNQQGDYILKPSLVDYPFLAENEHATMAVMNALGFDVPPNGLFPFQTESESEFAFVIKRFDRENGKPIHQEQLDGAMNITEKYGKIGSDNEQYVSYERVAKFILDHTEDNLVQRQELFRRVVYAYLLGNNDLHLRNFSLIYHKNGKIELAPVYDFVSVVPYKAIFDSSLLALPLLEKEEGGAELAHGFHTQYGEYIGQDFIEFGEKIGLNRKLIEQRLLPQLWKEQTRVESVYQHSFMPTDHKNSVLNNYCRRLKLMSVIDEPVI